MDVTEQLYPTDATGWMAGLYADVQTTFRAPIINWILRTTAANHPDFLRYLWGQVKPIFETMAFGNCSTAYRDAVLSQVPVPRYRREELRVQPAEFTELRGQVATFDVVAPRLAVLFETVDRGLNAALDPAPGESRAATEPLPPWLDRDRGREPTMTTLADSDGELGETVASIRAVHDLGATLPSIYRCLGQWPEYLVPAWEELHPVLAELDTDTVHAVVDSFVDELPYVPRLAPAELARIGIDEKTIEDMQALFGGFNRGPDQTVLPAIHLHAASVGVSGRRDPL